jgi:hypothetical protein
MPPQNMATCTQPVRAIQPAARAPIHALGFVLFAIGLPILAGLLWHQVSDNPLWPLLRNAHGRCELRDTPLSPLSPDGLYRVRVVQATYFGRFSETLVFVTAAADPSPLATFDPNRAVLEIAGLRSLDAIDWQETADAGAPILELWFTPGASPHQIHRLERLWRTVTILPRTSAPASGAGNLD